MRWVPLADFRAESHAPSMVALKDKDIIAIQAAYHESGELSAADEVHKRFRDRGRARTGMGAHDRCVAPDRGEASITLLVAFYRTRQPV